MENDLVGNHDTIVRKQSPQSDFKINRSLSTTKQQEELSFENDQDADDEVPMLGNSFQVPQWSMLHHEDIFKQQMDKFDSGLLGLEKSIRDFRSDSGDEIGGDALLWCQKANLNHAEILNRGLSTCPYCWGKVNKPLSKPLPQMSMVQGADKAASTDPGARRKSQFRYSNAFLWNDGAFMFSESWPELLDFDRERGKPAKAQRPADELILEIVTVVATNLTENSRSRHSTKWIISNESTGAQCVGKEVIIHSKRVMDALQILVPYYPQFNLGGTSLLITQPYAIFYHYLEEIKEFQNTCHRLEDQLGTEHPNTALKRTHLKVCDAETYKHLSIVREFIEQENLVEVQAELERHQQSPAVATFSMLWLLFKPGTKVYVRRAGSPVHVGVVLSVQGGDLSPWKAVPFSVDYWTLSFDGIILGRMPLHYVFKPFTGEKAIAELEMSPCDYYDEEDAGVLRDNLINRGQKFWKFLPGYQVDYVGKLPKDQSEWQGRVIVDPMTYYRYAHNDQDHASGLWGPMLAPPAVGNIQDGFSEPRVPSGANLPKIPRIRWQNKGPSARESRLWAEYDNIKLGLGNQSLELIDKVTGKVDMSRYLMCPACVIGFDLKARQWHTFYVACCHDAVFNQSTIDSLVMKEERKSVIRSLVHRYTATGTGAADGTQVPKPWTADFIKNKGEGQIFLLHGSPGVGKTYTAECIAEATRRPLLSLTCGDIGINEVTAEKKLSKWFRLAELWGAVMLLDEADVFLEKRTNSDLQRNSLVSVFLRIVEYYRGILFLTTNRVGQFDDAFISRIHTVIHYENFSIADQQRIWEQFFEKLEKERRKDIRVHHSAREYVFKNRDLREVEWNGRQIRNAFQTAVAFAEYRFLQTKPEDKYDGEIASLEDKDFAKVCEMTNEFQRYMTSIHGGDEARRARLERIRDDKFKETSSSL